MTGFRMTVERVFWVSGRQQPIVTGETFEGQIAIGQELDLISSDGARRRVVVRGIDFVCNPGGVAAPRRNPAERLGLLLGDGLAEADVTSGQILELSSPLSG